MEYIHFDNLHKTDYMLNLGIQSLWMVTAILNFKFIFYSHPKEQKNPLNYLQTDLLHSTTFKVLIKITDTSNSQMLTNAGVSSVVFFSFFYLEYWHYAIASKGVIKPWFNSSCNIMHVGLLTVWELPIAKNPHTSWERK